MNIEENKTYIKEIDSLLTEINAWGPLQGKTFFITGATGLIGSYLIDLLMENNRLRSSQINIIAVTRNRNKIEERFPTYLSSPFFHVYEGDVTSPLSTSFPIDYVIHAASNTHPVSYATDPIGTITTNVFGTFHLLNLASEKKARFLFLSSVEIYGKESQVDQPPFKETDCGYIDCATLRAGYPESKRVSESLIKAFEAQKQVDAVTLRLPRIFGPTLQASDTKALSQFLFNSVHHQNIILKSAGTQVFSYAYVGDVVRAIIFCLLKAPAGTTVNMNGKNGDISLLDLALYIAEQSHSVVEHEIPADTEKKGYSTAQNARLDDSVFQSMGFYPIFDLKESIKQTIQILSTDYKD
jgi:nucleoside-diphosphate-sugar epimerase